MENVSKIPSFVTKYFWGDDLSVLSWNKHKDYVIQTILEKGDGESIAWLFSKLDKNKLKKSLSNLKLTPKSRNFWRIYLS